MDTNVDPGTIDRLEALGGKLDVIEKSPEYINAMLALSQYQKDNFEMIDRSLTMMQQVHKSKLQNNAFYVDIIKFLAPIFATATITGLAVDAPGVSSSTLVISGGVGLSLSVAALVPLLVQRQRKANHQSSEYVKLSQAFDQWKKIADLRKAMNENEDFNINQTKEMLTEIFDLADKIESSR